LDYPRESTQLAFESLIAAIDGGKCALFMGAGLSKAIGYPDLQELLTRMVAEAGLAELQAKNQLDEIWSQDFQLVKETPGLDSTGHFSLRGSIPRVLIRSTTQYWLTCLIFPSVRL
jgi:hypothetical protein